MLAQSHFPLEPFGPDRFTSLHELAESQIPKWRAVAQLAAGNADDGDTAVEEFLHKLIIWAQKPRKVYGHSEIMAEFLDHLRNRFSPRFTEIKRLGTALSLLPNYDHLEDEMRKYLLGGEASMR